MGKSGDALDDDADLNPLGRAINFFKRFGGGGIEGEFDLVKFQEGIKYARFTQASTVGEDESPDITFDGINFINKGIKIGIHGRFTVGGDGYDVNRGVFL